MILRSLKINKNINREIRKKIAMTCRLIRRSVLLCKLPQTSEMFQSTGWENTQLRKSLPIWMRIAGWVLLLIAVLFCCVIVVSVPAHAETASWYGTTGDTCDKWKHTTTANGEHFNENAMTAASWKYHLGSLVKVTNIRNHRSILVRINDRGPGRHLYRKGRVIDLTRGAFARVADLRDGVIPIRAVLIERTI